MLIIYAAFVLLCLLQFNLKLFDFLEASTTDNNEEANIDGCDEFASKQEVASTEQSPLLSNTNKSESNQNLSFLSNENANNEEVILQSNEPG